jgi:signal transduction protein with GAF and PtsI domain
VPVEFGGIKGYVYFDQVNIDRYDGILGTPLLNRHGIVLDFRSRTIRFPNGIEVKALSVLEEAALIAERGAEHQVRKRDPTNVTTPVASPSI